MKNIENKEIWRKREMRNWEKREKGDPFICFLSERDSDALSACCEKCDR